MRSLQASAQLSQAIWPDFINNFRSESTIGSYLSDIEEFMTIVEKDFLDISAADVAGYYKRMKKKS